MPVYFLGVISRKAHQMKNIRNKLIINNKRETKIYNIPFWKMKSGGWNIPSSMDVITGIKNRAHKTMDYDKLTRNNE